VDVSRRRLKRRANKPHRPPPAFDVATKKQVVVREATRVERLAYTRTQAAEALGVSRSTFDRRVLPLIETIVMPWGTTLVPVDELERLLAERRQPARAQTMHNTRVGRPAALASRVVARIRAEHVAGNSLGAIARGLAADQIPTAHGGAQWWPSTVRAVLDRSDVIANSRD
jgi:hypothetical protein